MVESMQVREISALRADIDERKWRSTVLESPEGREKYLGWPAKPCKSRGAEQAVVSRATDLPTPDLEEPNRIIGCRFTG